MPLPETKGIVPAEVPDLPLGTMASPEAILDIVEVQEVIPTVVPAVQQGVQEPIVVPEEVPGVTNRVVERPLGAVHMVMGGRPVTVPEADIVPHLQEAQGARAVTEVRVAQGVLEVTEAQVAVTAVLADDHQEEEVVLPQEEVVDEEIKSKVN